MGRITANVTVTNVLQPEHSVRFDALVDTGAAYLVLPSAWQERLGDLRSLREVHCVTATQTVVTGQICGPVEIHVDGFEPVMGEVLFLDMEPVDGTYEPLLGYIPLEQCEAAVDMLGHRLIRARMTDLK